MSIPVTDELRQMNAYWRLLAGVMTELTSALDAPNLAPEERLAKVRACHDFVRPYVAALPESVLAEELARPEPHAALPSSGSGEGYYRVSEDGTLEGPFPQVEELRSLTKDELRDLGVPVE